MPIRFACECGRDLEAPEEHAGLHGPCPDCGADLVVPEGPVTAAIRPVSANGFRPATGATRTCPDCREQVSAEARVCRWCSHSFETLQERVHRLEIPSSPVSTLLPADFLARGEEVVYESKPHVLLLVHRLTTVLVSLLSALLLGGGWLIGSGGGGVPGIRGDAWAMIPVLAVIGVGIFLVVAAWAFFDWRNRTYALTTRRVVRIRGVLNRDYFECPLDRIQNTYLKMSLFQRMFGLGTVQISTAGGNAGGGMDNVEAEWAYVEHPAQVHRRVNRVLELHEGRHV